MKRRTLRQLRPKPQPEDHHSVYVVLPGAASGKLPRSEVVYNNQKARPRATPGSESWRSTRPRLETERDSDGCPYGTSRRPPRFILC